MRRTLIVFWNKFRTFKGSLWLLSEFVCLYCAADVLTKPDIMDTGTNMLQIYALLWTSSGWSCNNFLSSNTEFVCLCCNEGVLTKLDIMDRGTNALRLLKNEVVPLRLGYIGEPAWFVSTVQSVSVPQPDLDAIVAFWSSQMGEYDKISNNCNHQIDKLCRLLCDKGIPTSIDAPCRILFFFGSPCASVAVSKP